MTTNGTMDRNRNYAVFPQIGVAEIEFGMLASEVQSLWGPPTRRSKNMLGDDTEVRDASLITYDHADGGVAEIAFPWTYPNVTVKGIRVFQQPHAKTIEQLKQLDAQAYVGQGFIVFRNLAISLSGFGADDFEALTVTAFKAGWWDDDLADMAKLS
jgi:hypothetical protein